MNRMQVVTSSRGRMRMRHLQCLMQSSSKGDQGGRA
jgi:hypothetical protein